MISIAWISTIAGEVVGVLKTFGVVLNISEALLGLTIFAAGNSIGDLIADITVARLGYPVMAAFSHKQFPRIISIVNFLKKFSSCVAWNCPNCPNFGRDYSLDDNLHRKGLSDSSYARN